jgi:undecaprenyl-diphosphatase
MTDLINALLLGIIEGITEFLPISSTGHLLIAEHWLGARSDLFNIAIQAGAILAVVLIYRQRLWQLLLGWREAGNRDYALKLGAAFAVTAVLGLLVKKLGVELPETIGPIAWALVIGGGVMLAAEVLVARRGARGDAITWPVALLVGVAQVVAGVFPGTSRSAAAIFAALLFGTGNRLVATEFAFLIGIPTMFAATGYELLHVLRDGGAAGEDWTGLGVAFVTSAITAFVVVKWLLGYIQTHRFTVFSWYRIVLGIALLALPVARGDEAADRLDASQATPAEATAESAAIAGGTATARADATPTSNWRAGAAARTEADRSYAALKRCVDASQMNALLAEPTFRKDLERFAAGDGPQLPDRESRLASIDRLAKRLDAAERAKTDCQAEASRVADGSIYELALAAAKRGNANAATCYVAAAFPLDQRRWNDSAFHARYRSESLALVGRGIAAGDWRMVRLAQVIHTTARRLPQADLGQPWTAPTIFLPNEIEPEGDQARLYALYRLSALGENDWDGSDFAQVARLTARPLSPREIADGDAWAQRTYAVAFKNRPRAGSHFNPICE